MIGGYRLSGFGAIVLTILVALVVIGGYALIHELRRKWGLRQKERKQERLLGGRNLEDVLAEAPYKFAHFQGEDGYRLYDTRQKEDFLGFVYTSLDAHLWIVERYLDESKDKG
jgi:hypothetical protein